jgi:YebC/PmpR family DNA-binding regulatory protein
MAGHSKWKNIKHKKAKEDSIRGKAFTRLSKEITVVAKHGGGDTEANARLRLLLEKAKQINMPKENIERAIKKGTGQLESANYESILYEGYGPDGLAVLIETLTDNKNRTVSDLRYFFNKIGGNLADGGSVMWLFENKGMLEIQAHNETEEDIIEKLIDGNIEEVEKHETIAMIQTPLQELDNVRKLAEKQGYKVISAELTWIPKSPMAITDENIEQVSTFAENLEELDDVQNIYLNAE